MRMIELNINDKRRCLLFIAQIVTTNVRTMIAVTPPKPSTLAIFGNPLIIPLWITKNTTPVITIVKKKVFHSNFNFLKYIIRAINGSVNKFNMCTPVANPNM